MNLELNDKTVVVTGAQQGIGQALACAFGASGARVIVNYLDDRDSAEQTVATIERNSDFPGPRAIAVQADISDATSAEQLMAAAQQFSGIDVLVNNAAIFPRVDFLDMRPTDWDQVLGVNLRGAFLCSQLAARNMLAHGRGGSIINLTSVAARRALVRGAHYIASKAGLIGLTRATALELAPHGIRVNAIAPGLTDTAQPRYGMTEQELHEAGESVPLGGINSPDDLAGVALFLASSAAARITGQTIHVNGGEYFY